MELGKPIAIGNTAKIYHSHNKIIKVFNDFLPDTESINEANKQQYAYTCGLPVPEVFDVTQINGNQAIVMEYVAGDTLGDLLFKDKERAEYYMDISVDMQLDIHRIIPNPEVIEQMYDKLSRQIKSVSRLTQQQKTGLLKKLDSFAYESKLCHGDFHLYNVMKTDDNVVVIDWVDASAGDVRADVCRSYLLYSQVSRELAEMYLRLYCKKSGMGRDEVFQWAPVLAGARLSEHVATENSERLLKMINDSIS
ncbi:aminoglycoside phosphotransferase family protein [Alkalihalobacillus sp. LMS39]|uniref:aminoglycoside phosphotransferase family protein n=1 Tax=Alkalihalobacillus sp. LMS39 TaxID=2924032 RepID=UPI001FB31868|nr:aminoglycoside phosphotransferase family protein [Alkalihalobacillus sp. LMS39]UOE95234.1 aminoglycoside phosphotransferase family protein [Alkalihalobacillus sp. LMS39]